MKAQEELRSVKVTRYITPLREGGSLPALADADDGFKYVLKFKGSGHGVKSLISELLGGELARLLKLRVPELVFAHLDADFGRTEGDEEIQDLLKWSTGLNLAMHFLSGAVNYDPAVMKVDPLTASKIVWLDSFITNVDRTYRNTNMLMWHNELWLIDHGSSFYFHHNPKDWETKAETPFALIKDHVLLPRASQLDEVNGLFKETLSAENLRQIVNLIPDEWLQWEDTELTPDALRQMYVDFLTIRLQHADIFTKAAKDAR